MYTEIFDFITGIFNYFTFVTNFDIICYLTYLVYYHIYNTILLQMICNQLTEFVIWSMNQHEYLCEGITVFWLFMKPSL
jgi:hypothetical protein